jgi:hypothetical protein
VGTRMTLVSTICRMPAMKPVGERSAGNPHAAFDERGRETEQCYRARPRLYRGRPKTRNSAPLAFVAMPKRSSVTKGRFLGWAYSYGGGRLRSCIIPASCARRTPGSHPTRTLRTVLGVPASVGWRWPSSSGADYDTELAVLYQAGAMPFVNALADGDSLLVLRLSAAGWVELTDGCA